MQRGVQTPFRRRRWRTRDATEQLLLSGRFQNAGRIPIWQRLCQVPRVQALRFLSTWIELELREEPQVLRATPNGDRNIQVRPNSIIAHTSEGGTRLIGPNPVKPAPKPGIRVAE